MFTVVVLGVGVVVVVAKMNWNIIDNNNFQTYSSENQIPGFLNFSFLSEHTENYVT